MDIKDIEIGKWYTLDNKSFYIFFDIVDYDGEETVYYLKYNKPAGIVIEYYNESSSHAYWNFAILHNQLKPAPKRQKVFKRNIFNYIFGGTLYNGFIVPYEHYLERLK